MSSKKFRNLNILSGRLSLLIEKSTGKQSLFAEKIHFPESSISHWINDKEKPGADALLTIHEKFNVNLNWLLTGKGEMLIADQKKTIQQFEDEKRQIYKEPCMWALRIMIEKLDADDRKKLIKLISVCFDQELIECQTNEKPEEVKI